MRTQVLTVSGDDAALRARFAAIRAEHAITPDFPPAVLAEAASARSARLAGWADATDIPFITLDPPGSRDLDQAVHVARDGRGFRVRYAIAAVGAFITPGGALDEESRRRGQTIYCPDLRVPLYPAELSEGSASLLAGQVRPAYVWDLRLDVDGGCADAHVSPALIRSRAQLDYPRAHAAYAAGTADEPLLLLREVGQRRQEQEAARGGASLPMPDQQVDVGGRQGFTVTFRPLLPVEEWNAQISLLTGMAAARMMIDGGVGLLRTMPPPSGPVMERYRRQVAALGVRWSRRQGYGAFLRSLDHSDPRQLAVVYEAVGLFRGAGYAAFQGEPHGVVQHAALASAYAHVTAPLRRLPDRFTLAVCAALCAGEAVPDWVQAALPALPDLMASSDRVASAVVRDCVDATEASVLSHRIGEQFPAVVVDTAQEAVTVQVTDPAVVARADGQAPLGAEVFVRLVEADVDTSTVRFAVVPDGSSGEATTVDAAARIAGESRDRE